MRALPALLPTLCLAAAGALAGAAGPSSRPSAAVEGASGGVEQGLRGSSQDGLQPPETEASRKLGEAMEALRRVQVVPRPHGRTTEMLLAARRAAQEAGGAPTSQPATSQPAGEPGAASQPAAPAEPRLSKEVLEQLKGLPAAGLSNPLAVADELYRSGLSEAACVLYEHGLKHTQDPNAQGWALFQMANCRRSSDPAAAGKLYARVVSEHGKGLWAELAAVETKLLEWQEANRPLELLTSIDEVEKTAAGAATTQPATTQPTTQPTTRPAAAVGGPNPTGTK